MVVFRKLGSPGVRVRWVVQFGDECDDGGIFGIGKLLLKTFVLWC